MLARLTPWNPMVAYRRRTAGDVAPSLAPVNTVLPAISGTPSVGQTLTVSTGTWTGSPSGYAHQWKRDGSAISGATSSGYTVVSGDNGATLSCTVTATNAFGSTPATTAGVGPVGSSPSAVVFGAGDSVSGSSLALEAANTFLFMTRFRAPSLIDASLHYETNGSVVPLAITLLSSGSIAAQSKAASGTVNGNFQTAAGVVSAGDWCTYLLTRRGATGNPNDDWQAALRPDGGSWGALSPSFANNGTTALGAGTDLSYGGLTGLQTLELHQLYYAKGQTLDLTDPANLAKFVPGVSLGADGSVPTGVAPDVFLSGPDSGVAGFATNLGTAGALSLTGTLTAASTTPT